MRLPRIFRTTPFRLTLLFLGLFAPSQELNVVDQQQVAVRAIARAELVRAMLANRLDQIVRERLG